MRWCETRTSFWRFRLGTPRGGLRPAIATSFSGEDEITTALIRLREGEKTKVAFTVGHGEPSTADLNPRGRGIGNWKARLNKVGCEVMDLNLTGEEIPQDLALLIVVGPKSPFKPDEILKLRSFTDRGKPLLFLLGNTAPSGLEDFLKSFNLGIGKGLIVDPRYNWNGSNPLMPYAPHEYRGQAPDRRRNWRESGRAAFGRGSDPDCRRGDADRVSDARPKIET